MIHKVRTLVGMYRKKTPNMVTMISTNYSASVTASVFGKRYVQFQISNNHDMAFIFFLLYMGRVLKC